MNECEQITKRHNEIRKADTRNAFGCSRNSFGRACRKESVDVHRARGALAFSGARLSRQNFFLGKFLGAI